MKINQAKNAIAIESKLQTNKFVSFLFSAIDNAVKQLGTAIAQSLLTSVTEAMAPQLAGLARIPQQIMPTQGQIPQPLQLQTNQIDYTPNYYQGPQRGGRGRGRRARGRGGRGSRGRGRGRFQPYEHASREGDIARLTSELEKEREERKKLELELELTNLRVSEENSGKLLDSHFDLDRLNHIKRVTLENLTSGQIMPTPNSELFIEGGIMVFCNPKDFPNNEDI